MRAHDQSSIFSTGGKFCPDYGLVLELDALTLVAHSYALLLYIELKYCYCIEHSSIVRWHSVDSRNE